MEIPKNVVNGNERERGATVRRVAPPPEPLRARDGLRGAEPTLAEYAWTLSEGRWTIVLVLLLALAAGGLYLFVTPPTFVARSLIQVEQRQKMLAGLEELTAALGEKPPADAEIEVIRSRMLLGSVVDQLQLDLEVSPRYLPVVGQAFARRYKGRSPAEPRFGLARFAWGGERLGVQRLEVGGELLDAELLLTAGESGRFALSQRGETLLEGAVGKAAAAGDGPRRVAIFVSELQARPGTEFVVVRHPREDVVDRLQGELRVQERGKRSGILVLELEGPDPARLAAILNAATALHLRQSVEQKSAEATKTLEFLESQLPGLKQNVDAAESALNSYRLKNGTVDLSAETKGMFDRSAALEKDISELELKRSELRQTFTDNHPNVIAVAQKLALLRAEQAQVNQRMRTLPGAEVNSARFNRDVKVASELYTSLLNRAQELKVVKSGTLGDVRIIDRAQPPRHRFAPRAPPVLALSALLGLCGGVGLVLLRRALDQRAEDAEEIETATGLPVYVSIPHSDAEDRLARGSFRSRGPALPFLAAMDPGDTAVETLRSLRTSLQFALLDATSNVVALTGPAPGVGKSFVAVNLAWVLASTDRRVLLVDGDLRRGHLHRYFGIDRLPGLSDVVSGAAKLDEALHATHDGQLWILPTGRIPPNPAELLSSARFEALLAELSRRFDLVIVDTPPLLAVTDSLLVARLAGVNLLVLRSRRHTMREIALSAKQFSQAGARLHGAVLNDVQATHGRYGRHGRYVRYDYASRPD
ncbi:polysaccharide biosynthesis tyrosine autokinase [Anaeromyxobacter paludicola]|uniref:Tyrosine kinase BceF n=1 Tax=Anaeromyxobacter paludicola TaxID=2918171 RepID=A0ABM7X9M0_9BACT|nr:polysaccharide biosynthesis tyrosine autokinase [Anaeromyxobacter paludicola]BDG08527.1 tyrosine kinase BceF [Anaeromyxobacter paludicola]